LARRMVVGTEKPGIFTWCTGVGVRDIWAGVGLPAGVVRLSVVAFIDRGKIGRGDCCENSDLVRTGMVVLKEMDVGRD
jgi:hypothetical protein